MKRLTLIFILTLVQLSLGENRNVGAGKLYGVPFYWQTDSFKADTLLCSSVFKKLAVKQKEILSFNSKEDFEDQAVKKRIWATYLCAPYKKDPNDIIQEIESMMDALKLDLSYKPPQIKSLKKIGE